MPIIGLTDHITDHSITVPHRFLQDDVWKHLAVDFRGSETKGGASLPSPPALFDMRIPAGPIIFAFEEDSR